MFGVTPDFFHTDKKFEKPILTKDPRWFESGVLNLPFIPIRKTTVSKLTTVSG
jgi:hypothetical protein